MDIGQEDLRNQVFAFIVDLDNKDIIKVKNFNMIDVFLDDWIELMWET